MPLIPILIVLAGAFQVGTPDVQTLPGAVRGQTGAVLQGAIVELTEEGGAAVRSAATDSRGAFVIEKVPPGSYVLKQGDDAPAWSIGVHAFNVLNRVNYSGYIGTLSSPLFGRAIAAQPPRRIQVSVGFHF